MTHDLTRKYDSDFSATVVKETLNGVAKNNGSEFKTPVADAKPWQPGDGGYRENYFEVETRAGVEDLDEELGASQGEYFEASWRVLGMDKVEGNAIVKVEKIN